ncbi:MAG: ABC transporter substrate-binding protein, partial [Pseudomonadota bacterium]|nr:ABC transporter substrate-binding protein [Pseudomonadota bacterium]
MKRERRAAGAAAVHRWLRIFAVAVLAWCSPGLAADPAKVLRIASVDIETLDPQQYTDDPSFQVVMAIFEPAFEWDYLASPPKLIPLTAAAPAQVSPDGRTWTVTLQHGIFFTDDPAFKRKPRELVAGDYVYAYKRWLDPNGKRGGSVLADQILGARAVVDAAKKSGHFDFDQPIDGLRVLDRYTFEIRMSEANYPFIKDLIGFVGAVAREVVEDAGMDIRARPVGTGPYRLREWKRGSRIVLEANPGYREVRFPVSRVPAHAALQNDMQKRRLPAIGVVEISVIEEDITRLLKFEQGGLDVVVLRGETANRLLSNGKLKPEYAARGIARHAFAEPFLFSLYFHMPDRVVGGMSKEHIALRRAIALGLDLDALVRVVYAGQAIPANQLVPPGVGGHDPSLRTKPLYDPKAANALLDRFGYRRGADGYRNDPEGKPLTLTLSLRTGAVSREQQTLVKRSTDAIGVRLDFRLAPFQDIIKELQQGQYQMYVGGFGGSPSGQAELLQLYTRQSPKL